VLCSVKRLHLASESSYIAPMPRAQRLPATSSIGDYIRRQRQLAHVSLRKVAEQSGISAAMLREIENGLRNPTGTILQSIARALRLSAETLHLQAGVLDPQAGDAIDTVREIHRDPNLTERQRDTLIEIYEAFCAANRARRD
jgi:transcriptional regulator with XRE-family HTH domain